ATVRRSGLKLVASIVRVCVLGPPPLPAPPTLPSIPKARGVSAEAAAIHQDVARVAAAIVMSVSLLPDRRLNVLRVFEVRDERRPHFDEERLQLGVARTRDERLVDGVEHCLVIRDLVVDVCLVERRTFERL